MRRRPCAVCTTFEVEATGLDAQLRPYQQDGFRWLAFLWSARLGGILADDMGLGKALQTLALVAHAQARERTVPGRCAYQRGFDVERQGATFTPA